MSGVSILVVRHRRPGGVQWSLASWSWRWWVLILAGMVVPLMLAVVSYRVIADMVPPRDAPVIGATLGADGRQGLHHDVVALSASTAAGLRVLDTEISQLSAVAARLSVLRDRLASAVGLNPAVFAVPRPAVLPARYRRRRPRVMVPLRRQALALRSPVAVPRRRGL